MPNALDDGWGGFREAFPQSRGYLILSAVGFNADKTLALVYVEHRCRGLCAAARYYILEKRKAHWTQYNPIHAQGSGFGNEGSVVANW